MESTFELTAVAFIRSAGGVVRVLLAVDRDGEPLFEGDPVLLVEHRPGESAVELRLEGPDHLPDAAIEAIEELARLQLVEVVESAFDDVGSFDPERMLGRFVRIVAPCDLLDV